MKSITCLRDLFNYGVRPLTGEADNLGFRILCDLTERGRGLICEAFSIQPEGFRKNWNSGAVASIMLAPEDIFSIGIVALLEDCHTVVITNIRVLYGLEKHETWCYGCCDDDKYTKPGLIYANDPDPFWPSTYGKPVQIIKAQDHPHRGTRNVHAMSGRTV